MVLPEIEEEQITEEKKQSLTSLLLGRIKTMEVQSRTEFQRKLYREPELEMRYNLKRVKAKREG